MSYKTLVPEPHDRIVPNPTPLLGCPFCGSEAEIDTRRTYRSLIGGVIGNAVAIYCTGDNGCPADMSICCEDVPEASTEQLVDELTALWNRRAKGSGAWR